MERDLGRGDLQGGRDVDGQQRRALEPIERPVQGLDLEPAVAQVDPALAGLGLEGQPCLTFDSGYVGSGVPAFTRVKEIMERAGVPMDDPVVVSVPGGFRSTVAVTLPNGSRYSAEGTGTRKTFASEDAARRLLPELLEDPTYGEEADRTLWVDALAGDGLIKLAVYLDPGDDDKVRRNATLNRLEANVRLAALFDVLHEAGDPRVICWGTGLGVHRKATVVEAMLWRTFSARILRPDAASALGEVLTLLRGLDASEAEDP